jgi:hypothetical protein
MHLADLVDHASVEKDALRESGFARINVRTNADIPRALQRIKAIWAIGIGGHEINVRDSELEAEVSESAVGLSHFMNIVTFANGVALIVSSVFEFVSKSYVHRSTFAIAGVVNEPSHGESFGARCGHFQRHLIGSTADTTGLYLNTWLSVLDGTGDNFERIDGFSTLASTINGGVNNALGEGTFAVAHDFGNEIAHESAIVAWIAFFRLVEDSFAA